MAGPGSAASDEGPDCAWRSGCAFKFYAPPDPLLDRDGYFERCWPNSGPIKSFEFVRMFEHADEVVVTYESEKTDGSRYRNTEILTFEGDRIREVEVYFEWDL